MKKGISGMEIFIIVIIVGAILFTYFNHSKSNSIIKEDVFTGCVVGKNIIENTAYNVIKIRVHGIEKNIYDVPLKLYNDLKENQLIDVILIEETICYFGKDVKYNYIKINDSEKIKVDEPDLI